MDGDEERLKMNGGMGRGPWGQKDQNGLHVIGIWGYLQKRNWWNQIRANFRIGTTSVTNNVYCSF